MLAVAIAVVIVAVVLFFVGVGEAFWRSDTRRRRAFVREQQERQS